MTRGLALTGVDAVFGAGLIAFAFSPGLGAAVLPLLVVGAAAAASDSLSQSLVQRAAGDAERGAAMGLWAFALGVGPLGHIVAGAAAGQFGAVATQAVFGGLLVLVMIVLSFQPLDPRIAAGRRRCDRRAGAAGPGCAAGRLTPASLTRARGACRLAVPRQPGACCWAARRRIGYTPRVPGRGAPRPAAGGLRGGLSSIGRALECGSRRLGVRFP